MQNNESIPFDTNRTYEWLIISQSYLQCSLITARMLKLELSTHEYGVAEGSPLQWCLKEIYGRYGQDCNYLIFPILFNFKHGVELYLKTISGMDTSQFDKKHNLISLLTTTGIKNVDCKRIIEKYHRCNFLMPNNNRGDESNTFERYAAQDTPYNNFEFYDPSYTNDKRLKFLPKLKTKKIIELIEDIEKLTDIIREESLERLRNAK